MSRYHDRHASVEYVERPVSPEYGFSDPRVDPRSLVGLGAGYNDYGRDASRTSLTLVRPAHHHHERERSPTVASTVIQEPVIEHEHHHVHHHIDHGDISAQQLFLDRATRRPRQLAREYSYDDLDVRERRYANGNAVTSISVDHVDRQSQGRRHRHRHRHRSRNGEVEQVTRYARSDVDLRYEREDDELTIIDVPNGTRRLYVNIEKGQSRPAHESVDWRRERGIRRSRGLGNELWTEITKDLITREAIEECGYPFEETDFFYYIFEYLDREQIHELRELTDEIRRERALDLEYRSISGGSQYGGYEHHSRQVHPQPVVDDNRTEIIIEHSHNGNARRRYYH
ncbi:hypothetical protein FN846DRAFT_139594 [Sphaerosporella brunnea]|uniref:DUF8035 domain-containing protein n=1 Tax=Sphaerosporella brunnea TaxID=1250544 RepID=A0A5J5ERT9_9PEZI|nr:hypothetical protein FN846DRAFT_139594 [Sphaerosporella brunnea]